MEVKVQLNRLKQLSQVVTEFIPELKVYSFLLLGLLSGLGGGSGHFLSSDALDDTDGNSLPHVTDSETSKRGEFREGLHAHGLGWDQLDDGGVARLDGLGVGLGGLTGTTIDLLLDLVKLAGNVSGVAIQDGRVAVADLAGVVQHDDLSGEVLGGESGLVLGVGSDVATLDVLDGDVLDVEANVVSGHGLGQRLVVHLNGLDLSGQTVRGEGDDHTGLDDTGLDTTDGHCSNTANFVDILEGQAKGLVGRASRGDDGIQSFQEGGSLGVSFLAGDFPALVPAHVGGGFQHVVAVPSGDGHEGNSGGVVADLLNEGLDFLGDFIETSAGVGGLGGVHLVDTDDELLDAQGVGQEGVLTGLTVLGDTGLELTSTGGDDQDTAIGLGRSSDHVLDEIPVAGGVNDGDVELGSLELPESNVDGDTTFTLGLELVQNPGIFEGALAHLLGLLFELLDGTLVDSTAFVDQVTSGG
jgi:hypothetical protein